jgi:hypothetical protein
MFGIFIFPYNQDFKREGIITNIFLKDWIDLIIRHFLPSIKSLNYNFLNRENFELGPYLKQACGYTYFNWWMGIDTDTRAYFIV